VKFAFDRPSFASTKIWNITTKKYHKLSIQYIYCLYIYLQ